MTKDGAIKIAHSAISSYFNVLGGYRFVFLQNHKVVTVVEENTMHILWQIPQYFVLNIGELMIMLPGMEFSYSQASRSMKSVMQSVWLLTLALGQLLVVIIDSLSFGTFETKASIMYILIEHDFMLISTTQKWFTQFT